MLKQTGRLMLMLPDCGGALDTVATMQVVLPCRSVRMVVPAGQAVPVGTTSAMVAPT
jgi:hypothetical protein